MSIQKLESILLAQLDRLDVTDLKGEALENEIKRTEAIKVVSQQLTDTYKIKLQAASLVERAGYAGKVVLNSIPQDLIQKSLELPSETVEEEK